MKYGRSGIHDSFLCFIEFYKYLVDEFSIQMDTYIIGKL